VIILRIGRASTLKKNMFIRTAVIDHGKSLGNCEGDIIRLNKNWTMLIASVMNMPKATMFVAGKNPAMKAATQ